MTPFGGGGIETERPRRRNSRPAAFAGLSLRIVNKATDLGARKTASAPTEPPREASPRPATSNHPSRTRAGVTYAVRRARVVIELTHHPKAPEN